MKLHIDIVRGPVTRVTLAGMVDEDADLSPLATLEGDVELHLAGIRRINSVGVRMWVEAIAAADQRARIVFVACARAVIDQVNMIRGFLGHGSVRSFEAPMRCEACDRDDDVVVETAACPGGRLPPAPCPQCGAPMVLDDLESSYLLFLRG